MSGHTCGYRGKNKHCWYCRESDLTLINKSEINESRKSKMNIVINKKEEEKYVPKVGDFLVKGDDIRLICHNQKLEYYTIDFNKLGRLGTSLNKTIEEMIEHFYNDCTIVPAEKVTLIIDME